MIEKKVGYNNRIIFNSNEAAAQYLYLKILSNI